jgi:hypothetical protein
MTRPRGEEEDVAAFARAFARVTDPFAERATLLAEMRLDEPQWRALEQRWFGEIARRERAGDRTLAGRFRAAYVEARDAIAADRREAIEEPAVDEPREATPFVVDTTVPGIPRLEPALPFKGSRQSAPLSPPEDPADTRANVDATLLLEETPVIESLPFKPPTKR